MATRKPQVVPVERLSWLDDSQLDSLRRAYITSVEALVGQLEADPHGIESLLHINRPELRSLRAAAEEALPTHIRKEFTRRAQKRYSYGALDPNQD